jgi:hypothetical protein
MSSEIYRTCSASQASILTAAAGKSVRIGSLVIHILAPTGCYPIDKSSPKRYVARVEVLGTAPVEMTTLDWQTSNVIAEVFGMYLDDPALNGHQRLAAPKLAFRQSKAKTPMARIPA